MKVISKREHQVISLYSRGLKFREIATALSINTRTAITYYRRANTKDKGRVTRAKKSRVIHKSTFSTVLKINTTETKKIIKFYSIYNSQYRPLTVKEATMLLRHDYIKESLVFAFQSYNRFKFNLLKKFLQKETVKSTFYIT